MLEGRSIKKDFQNFELDSINNAQLRSVRITGETPVREDSKVIGLHNKGSRKLIRKSGKQLNATKGESSVKILEHCAIRRWYL